MHIKKRGLCTHSCKEITQATPLSSAIKMVIGGLLKDMYQNTLCARINGEALVDQSSYILLKISKKKCKSNFFCLKTQV